MKKQRTSGSEGDRGGKGKHWFVGGGGVVRCCAPLCVSFPTAVRSGRQSARTRGNTGIGVARATSCVQYSTLRRERYVRVIVRGVADACVVSQWLAVMRGALRFNGSSRGGM